MSSGMRHTTDPGFPIPPSIEEFRITRESWIKTNLSSLIAVGGLIAVGTAMWIGMGNQITGTRDRLVEIESIVKKQDDEMRLRSLQIQATDLQTKAVAQGVEDIKEDLRDLKRRNEENRRELIELIKVKK